MTAALAYRDRDGDFWTVTDDGLGLVGDPSGDVFDRDLIEREWGPLVPCPTPGVPS